MNDTKIDTILTKKPIVAGRTNTERLMDDITEAQKAVVCDLSKNKKKMKFIELRAMGVSYQDSATILNCSKTTLINWNRELSAEITQYQNAAKNDILQAYHVSQSYRLRHFSDIYRRIKAELDRRTLREIPTEKLFNMLDKCSKCLDELTETTDQSNSSPTQFKCVQNSIQVLSEQKTNNK